MSTRARSEMLFAWRRSVSHCLGVRELVALNICNSTNGIANKRMEYEIGLVQIFHLRLRAQPRTIGF